MHKPVGRPDNKEKMATFIQDAENTHLWQPMDAHGSKWFGSWSRLCGLQQSLLHEDKEKYHNKFMAAAKAKAELESLPICFD